MTAASWRLLNGVDTQVGAGAASIGRKTSQCARWACTAAVPVPATDQICSSLGFPASADEYSGDHKSRLLDGMQDVLPN